MRYLAGRVGPSSATGSCGWLRHEKTRAEGDVLSPCFYDMFPLPQDQENTFQPCEDVVEWTSLPQEAEKDAGQRRLATPLMRGGEADGAEVEIHFLLPRYPRDSDLLSS